MRWLEADREPQRSIRFFIHFFRQPMNVAVVLAVCAALGLIFAEVQKGFQRDLSRSQAWAQQGVGLKEPQVIALLGPPSMVIDRPNANDYPVDGYEAPPRKVTERMLVYQKGHIITYVFIDRRGVAVATFCGFS